MRAIYAEFLSGADFEPRPNHWNPRLPAGWLQKQKEEQLTLLGSVVASQLRIRALPPMMCRSPICNAASRSH